VSDGIDGAHEWQSCATCGTAAAWTGDITEGRCIPCFTRFRRPTTLDQDYERGLDAVKEMPWRLREALEKAGESYLNILAQINKKTEWIKAELGRIDALPEKTPEDRGRVIGLRAALLKSLQAIDFMAAYPELVVDTFPGNPVQSYITAVPENVDYRAWFKPNRIYLDVTDATREDVIERWTEVEWIQQDLRGRGLSNTHGRGRPSGSVSPEVQRWLSRVDEVGMKEALAEFKQETPAGRGQWMIRSKWWDRNIAKRRQKTR
jgi:hypothetical protein